MKVEQVSVSRVIPYEKNPRKNEAAVAKVASSIREFGFRQPIVVDEKMVVIAGHTRLLAARSLGMEQVPIHIARGLTPAKVRAYRLADNRTNEDAEWDRGLLAGELAALKDAEFDLTLTGFGTDELERLLASLEGSGLAAGADPDDAPAKPGRPITRPGELIKLGRHRLLCGDATNSDSIQQVMGGTLAHMIWTDPPYNVAYTGKTKDALTIENDAMSGPAFHAFLLASFTAMLEGARPFAPIYIAHADMMGHIVRAAVIEAGWLWKQCLVWVKNCMVLGRQDYQWRHEPILYGWKPGAGQAKAGHPWFSDRCQTTILEFDKPSRSVDHPTMKPVALITYCLNNSCPPSGRVLDPFGGSGSTLIACEMTGRSAYLIELDAGYCDVIVARWEKATGRKAQRGTG